MSTLAVAGLAFVGFIVAYHTYGRWLARRIFGLDPDALVPSQQLRDDVDFVPTKKGVIFGHHFTSIAGTGPIVGPAIAVFWGWLPALLWVVLGSIFIGAVHDFGALVVSLRNRGQTVGEVAGRLINPRARLLFLLILFAALTIVLAIFGLVIATIFKLYPAAVLSVWIELPIAIGIGYWVYKRQGSLLLPSLIALGLLYVAMYLGAYHFPISIPVSWGSWIEANVGLQASAVPIVFWTLLLMVYCFIASVLPVWTLMQPRDYINSHQLVVALVLLVLGLFLAGISGQADLASAPPVADFEAVRQSGAPPIWPFLFITIACGAISGFHCLVSSGTSSKQLESEADAQYVGYGAMLLEGALAVIVILACCAGLGMGAFAKGDSGTLLIDAGSGDHYHAVEAIAASHTPQVSQGGVGYGHGANPSGDKNWSLDINVIFPNFFVDVASGWYFTYNFWPLSPDRTLYEMKNYYAPPRNASERFSHEYSRALLRDVLQEDLHMIEQSHAGMVSAPRRDILLSDSEVCVRHHLKVVNDHVCGTD